MRKKETIVNLFVSVFNNVVILVMGLLIPRIILTHYGSDANGLIGTISQIFTYVALLEAGIGQATLNSLYKPLKENNQEDVINVLCASKAYYRKVTYVYAICVICLSIVLPFAIKSELSYITIFFVVLFEGASGVINFFFVQTQSIFLVADGKTYVKSIIDLIIKIGGYGIKIILALLYVNIVYIQLGFFVLSLITLLLYNIVMKKMYAWVDYSKCTNKKIKLPNRNDYIVTELAWTLFSSTDLIVLSLFVSTKMSSVYSTNNMVFLALNNLLNAAYNGVYYLLGRSYYESMDKYQKIHDAFNSFFMAMVTIFMCVALLLAGPFVKIYTAGVMDINYDLYWLPLFFCLVQMFSWSRYVSGNLTGVAGYAKPVSRISLIEAFINLTLSIILVNIWGIYGVILATVLALPLKVVYTNYLAEKVIMRRTSKNTLIIFSANYGVFGITIFLREFITFNINSYFEFVVQGIVLTLIYSLVVLGMNVLINRNVVVVLKKAIHSRKSN